MTKIQRGAVLRTANAFDGMDVGTLAIAGVPAVALSDNRVPILEVLVQNDPASANNVLVGDIDGQYVVLIAGASITIPINDLSQVYVFSVGATVNWIAMR